MILPKEQTNHLHPPPSFLNLCSTFKATAPSGGAPLLLVQSSGNGRGAHLPSSIYLPLSPSLPRGSVLKTAAAATAPPDQFSVTRGLEG